MASDDDTRAELIAELGRIGEDSLYSSKGHFNACEWWGKINYSLGIPSAILAAVAGVSALSQFDKHNVVAGVLAILVAGLTGLMTFLNPSERAKSHQTYGNEFNSLKTRCRLIAKTKAPRMTIDDLASDVGELSAERDKLNSEAPQIPQRAFEKARRGIEEGEAKYVVDE